MDKLTDPATSTPPEPATASSPSSELPGSLDCSVCEWGADEDGTWGTACNEEFQFNDGGPVENGFNHCPYCGRPLIQANDQDQRPLAGKEAHE